MRTKPSIDSTANAATATSQIGSADDEPVADLPHPGQRDDQRDRDRQHDREEPDALRDRANVDAGLVTRRLVALAYPRGWQPQSHRSTEPDWHQRTMTLQTRGDTLRTMLITAHTGRWTATLAVIAAAALASPAGAAPTPTPTPTEKTGPQQQLQRDADGILRYGAPGVLAGVQTDDGDLKVRSGYGDLAARKPVPWNARFRIGSMTKPFVATTVLQLVGEGRLSLDDARRALAAGPGPRARQRRPRDHRSPAAAAHQRPARLHRQHPLDPQPQGLRTASLRHGQAPRRPSGSPCARSRTSSPARRGATRTRTTCSPA